MTYAVFSDVHGKLGHLQRLARELITEYKPDKIICLGDSLSDPPYPAESAEIIFNLMRAVSIKGNVDQKIIAKYLYTFKMGGPESEALSLFNRLPDAPLIVDDKFAICHASATAENKYIRGLSDLDAEFNWMIGRRVNILFFGHTHLPQIFSYDPLNKAKRGYHSRELFGRTLQLNRNKYYLVNPGSVGIPKDASKAGFLIFNDTDWTINYYIAAGPQ